MPRLLCLVLARGPYGSIEPAEAIRHAGGALGKGWEVVLGLMGDGVYTVLAGQSSPGSDWVCLSTAVTALVDKGGPRTRVLVDRISLETRGLSVSDLIAGVQPASSDEIAQAMAACDRALVF